MKICLALLVTMFALIEGNESGQLYYCTTMPENAIIAQSVKTPTLPKKPSVSDTGTTESSEEEIIRLVDCKAAMLIKPLDDATEKLLSKCIQRGVLKVNIVPFIVVGNYELPDDKFPAFFANERPHDTKEPYDFLVHWFTGEDHEFDYDYEDRGLEKVSTKASPLQTAIKVMRRGFKEAQKLAGQIIKFGTRPGAVGPAAAGFVAGTLIG